MSKVVKQIKKSLPSKGDSLEGFVKKQFHRAKGHAMDWTGASALKSTYNWFKEPYEEMEKAYKDNAAQQAKIEEQNRIIQDNMSRDLAGENVAEVIAGGSAELEGMSSGRRRRRAKNNLTSSLQV